MQVVGFNFSKISGEKIDRIVKAKRNMGFEFVDLEKDKIPLLKDLEALKIKFKHNLSYDSTEEKKDQKLAEIVFEGNLIMSLTKEELKDIMKLWKKKEVPEGLRMTLSNIILERCTAKTIQLQQELNIPSHIALPRIDAKQPN